MFRHENVEIRTICELELKYNRPKYLMLTLYKIVFQVYLVNTPFVQDIDFERSHCSAETEASFNDKYGSY